MEAITTPACVRADCEDESFVIVKAGASLFALPAAAVRSMVRLPRVVKVPGGGSDVRGVINLRGQVLPVVDLRLLCGMEPLSAYTDGLCKLLEQREQDHRNWLGELEKSVTERRKFGLTTDPHACAFGKWYDHYRTDDLLLRMLLKQFDAPHKAIHAVGREVEGLKARGDFEGAMALVDEARIGTLLKLIRLFASAREHIRGAVREIAVVIERDGRLFALGVDSVESAERLEAASISEMPRIAVAQRGDLVRGVARRKKDQQMVLLLDVRLAAAV
jgi:purine-binding chemotaxis protein CheW